MKCPKCKNEIQPNWKNCPKCGAKLQPNPEAGKASGGGSIKDSVVKAEEVVLGNKISYTESDPKVKRQATSEADVCWVCRGAISGANWFICDNCKKRSHYQCKDEGKSTVNKVLCKRCSFEMEKKTTVISESKETTLKKQRESQERKVLADVKSDVKNEKETRQKDAIGKIKMKRRSARIVGIASGVLWIAFVCSLGADSLWELVVVLSPAILALVSTFVSYKSELAGGILLLSFGAGLLALFVLDEILNPSGLPNLFGAWFELIVIVILPVLYSGYSFTKCWKRSKSIQFTSGTFKRELSGYDG